MKYKQSVSGFSVDGEWLDVVEMGERTAFALSNTIGDESSRDIERFNYWRPKVQEDFSTDMNRKTSREMSLDTDSKRIGVQSEDSLSRKLPILLYDSLLETVGRTEKFVYQNIMTKISPYYFDSQLLSANLKKVDVNQYRIEININDDDIKTEIAQTLSRYEDEYDRWHIGLEFDASSMVSSEGIEEENIQRSDTEDYNPKK